MDWKKVFAIIGLGILVYVGMKYLLIPAIPFLLGWILACWILPIAKWIEKRLHIKRGIAGGILLSVATGALGFGIWKLVKLLLGQLRKLMVWFENWNYRADQMVNRCCGMIETYTGIKKQEVYQFLLLQEQKLQENIQDTMGTQGFAYLIQTVKGIIFVFSSILVVLIFGTLLIKDMEQIQQKLQENSVTRTITRISRNIWKAGGKYLKAQCEIMLVVAAICVVVLWILGNPYFLLAGSLIGILDALPVLGAGMILIPWSVLWLLQGNYWNALWYLCLYFLVDLVRQFLEPRILGKEIGLHPALMLISVYGGFFLFGISGFLLGPVMVLILINLWKELCCKKENCNKM